MLFRSFTVAECTAGSGDSCGSTALNRNFSNILRAKIRKMKLPDGSKTAGRVYAKCIMDFENRIKADFRNNGQKWAVDVGIEAEFPEAGIEEGYMTFTNEEILQCFEPVVNRILELVRNQIIAIQAQNRLLQVRFIHPRLLWDELTLCRMCWSSVASARPSTSSNKSSFTCHPNTRTKWYDPWTLWPRLSRVPLQPVSLNVSSRLVLHEGITSWPLCNRSRKATIPSNTASHLSTARIDAGTHGRFSCKRASVSRLANPSKSHSSVKWHPVLR